MDFVATNAHCFGQSLCAPRGTLNIEYKTRKDNMKLMTISCAVLVFLTGCTTIHRMDGTALTAISASSAQAEPGKWEELERQVSAGQAVVVRIEAGQEIPLKLTMTSPVADLAPGENRLLFTRDAYLYISPDVFRVSPDGQRWADIHDLTAQKKLFGLKKGTLSVGFGAATKEGPYISLDVTAH